MTSVYFIRHGQSQCNVDGVYAGISDSPLTDRGRQQAQQVAKLAQDLDIKTIITSDLSRAYDTAYIIAEELGIDRKRMIIDKRLREVDVGQLTGKPERGVPGTEHAHLPGYIDFCGTENNVMGVEFLGDTVRKMEELIADLDHYSAPILLIGHDMSGRVLKQVFEGVKVEPTTLPSLPNGEILSFTRAA